MEGVALKLSVTSIAGRTEVSLILSQFVISFYAQLCLYCIYIHKSVSAFDCLASGFVHFLSLLEHGEKMITINISVSLSGEVMF